MSRKKKELWETIPDLATARDMLIDGWKAIEAMAYQARAMVEEGKTGWDASAHSDMLGEVRDIIDERIVQAVIASRRFFNEAQVRKSLEDDS